MKTLFVDARAPVRRQRNGAGRRRDRHADWRGSRRRSVGDRIGKAVRTAEARGGGISDRVVRRALIVAVPSTAFDTAVMVRGLLFGIAVISEHGNVDRSACRRRRRIGNRDGGVIAGRLAFEGGGDADVANALRVAQSACAGAEAEIGEVRAAEELRSDVAGERRSHLAGHRRCSSESASSHSR